MNTRRLLAFVFMPLLLLAACNLSGEVVTTLPPPTAPNVRIAQAATLAPVPTRELRPIASPTVTATLPPTATAIVCAAAEAAPVRHSVVATIDYASKQVQVAQQTRYRNLTGSVLSEMVFAVEPNHWQGAFVLEAVRSNMATLQHVLENNRLTITLPQPLETDCEITIELAFQVLVPRIGSGITAFQGYFSYGERQLNMANWLATVAPYLNGRWVVNPPQRIGEQTVLGVADWDVTLNIMNASGDLKIAAPGDVTQTGATQWRYVFPRGRDFSISLSEYYRVNSQMTPSGVTIEVYSFPDAVRSTDNGPVDAGIFIMQQAANALQQYADLFGVYPYQRLVVVQGDFPDGMEFSGLVFVSTNWVYAFEGGYDNYLTVITVHEVSHQWWYTRVGNDAANAPWLDEALATYSEYIYYEEFYPDLKNWWWDFRVGGYNPQGAVDSSVYEFDNARDYINAVYLRGVQMLHNLREDIGTEAFFKLLADYARVGDGQIATPQLFWSLLTPEQYTATQDTRGQFLRIPEVR
jgi:hypothetical protein